MFDFRLGQSFLFFFVYSLLSGSLVHIEASKGVSFARAIAIVFLLNEVEQFFYYQQLVENFGTDKVSKHQLNARLEFINGLFPDTYCVFEKIEMQRMFYFLLFNIACCVAQINFISDKV